MRIEVAEFDKCTNGFGYQLYDLRCGMLVNHLKREKAAAKQRSSSQREQYTCPELISRDISEEVHDILRDLLGGKRSRLVDNASSMVQRGNRAMDN